MLNAENTRKKKVSEIIVDELIEQIRLGKIKPGQKLPNERNLAEQLGVSRMSLREALQVLHQVGIVESRHGTGTFVCEYTSEKVGKAIYWYSLLGAAPLLDLVAARRVMEAEAARLAAINATPEEVEAIRAAMEKRERLLEAETEETGITVRRLEAGSAFHRSIAIASHNAAIVQFLSAIEASTRIHQETVARSRLIRSEVSLAHKAIYEAIAAGDAGEAERLMHEHIDQVAEAVSRQIKLETTPARR